MREIILDTETTGLDPNSGHRIIEIGCLEVHNLRPTGQSRQFYLNPERDIPEDAVRIHGLTRERLQNEPLFHQIVDEFLDFIGEDMLVIHNAPFDIGFLNAELARCNKNPIPLSRTVDTVQMARRLYPGAQASLDALCRRFAIDNSRRTFHGALLDCELLGEVYLELKGGRQPDLHLSASGKESSGKTSQNAASFSHDSSAKKWSRTPRYSQASSAEKSGHEEMLDKIENPLWKK